MGRAVLAQNFIGGHIPALGLHVFLQGALGVGFPGLRTVANEAQHHFPGGGKAPVQIHGGQHRFKGIAQHGGVLPPAAGLAAFVHAQGLAQTDALCRLGQLFFPH